MPQRHNALNEPLLKSLLAALTAASIPTNRVILLQSKGDTFCNGMDIEGLGGAHHQPSSAMLQATVAHYNQLLEWLSTSALPVVAIVQGAVRGGGVGIVSACDVVIATPHASFELSELLFGLIPANVIPQLLQRLLPYRIRYMALTAQPLKAEKAYHYGLVDEVIAEAQLEKRLRQLCRQLLRIEPSAVSLLKQSLDRSAWHNPTNQRSAAATELLALLARPAVQEALTSFSEGGTPAWYHKLSTKKELVE